MTLTTPIHHQTIDLSGLRCPHLLITTIQALRQLQAGQVLRIIATDLNAPSNIAAWARQSGTPLLDMFDEDDHFIFFLQCQR